jgi:DNA mismatch repair protein MutS2
VPFCDAAALERLEWPRLVEHLAGLASTAQGAERCREDPFQPTRAAVLERLAETGEARALLDADANPPFGGVSDLRAELAELALGRTLAGPELARALATLDAARRVRDSLLRSAEQAPRLCALAQTLPELAGLSRALAALITPEGEVRDQASPELARARRRVRELEAEVETIIARALRDPEIREHLQDEYATFRENRPVLPVRAGSGQRVRGIVHDVSSSGTTVFIEPEAAVEAGNRLRIARIEVERETLRVLRLASEALRERALEIAAQGTTLAALDAALARGRLSRRLDASAPELVATPVLELRGLRHPLLLLEAGLAPDDVVASDLALPDGAQCLVISGPNAGGKSVAAKAVGLAALALRAGLHLPCAPGSRMSICDSVLADIGDEQDLRAGLSTFSARMRNASRILAEADAGSLVILDEIGEGTEPGEGAALAQALLEALVERGARVIATTHFNRLKELAGSDPRFANASAEFDARSLAPTYRIHAGVPGSSGAMFAAERMGLDPAVVERARGLLDREDRRLEALTRSLSELRQELEAERALASRAREQTELAREAYERRLSTLRRSREAQLAAMKTELESAFKAARAEIAAVVRSLQRGEGAPSSGAEAGRSANRAQQRLREIAARSSAAEREHAEQPAAAAAVEAALLVPGMRIELAGVPGEAVVLEAPDRRGRVAVRSGSARSLVPLQRVARVLGPRPAAHAPPRVRVAVERAADGPGSVECDLRGLRVDEALERADAHLQAHLGLGSLQLVFIHGHGSGALRDAVRGWLRGVAEIAELRSGAPGEGGNGVTIVRLES